MLDNLIPAGIMFLMTTFFAAVLFLPILKVKQRNDLISFYWIGFWLFLVAIWAFSGGVNTLLIMQLETRTFGNAVLFAITISFVLFVMFAWFRLVGLALVTGAKKIKHKL